MRSRLLKSIIYISHGWGEFSHLDYSNSFDTFVFVSDGLSRQHWKLSELPGKFSFLFGAQTSNHAIVLWQLKKMWIIKQTNQPRYSLGFHLTQNIFYISSSVHFQTKLFGKDTAKSAWDFPTLPEGSHQKNGCFTVRLTVRVNPSSPRPLRSAFRDFFWPKTLF